MGCDRCTHTKLTPCDYKNSCEYEVHKRRVLANPLQILNYAYLLYEGNYVGRFSDYPMVICDEADKLEGQLANFVELRITQRFIDKVGLKPPSRKTAKSEKGLEVWRKWAEGAQGKLLEKLKITDSTLKDTGDLALSSEKVELERLHSRLSIFLEHIDSTWLYQEQADYYDKTMWTFRPVWLTPKVTEKYFWRHGNRHLLMSATMPPKNVLAEMLGLNSGDIDVIEIPSTFPLANRPVYLDPVADMSLKSFDYGLPDILNEIESLIHKHRGEKGVIHTRSWKLNQAVMSLNNPRLVTHTPKDKLSILESFRASDDLVLVSPSATRGIDLPDEACRFIIIAKAPYESLGDKLVNSRVYGSGLGRYWYKSICAQDIVQASGRGMRH